MALGFDQQGFYVLVVNENNLVERRGVTLGTQVDDLRVIEDGLKGDEWVVVNGHAPGHSRPAGHPAESRKLQRPPAGDKTAPATPAGGKESPPMISRFFIERPIFANVIAIITMIIGLVCFPAIAGGAVSPRSCRPPSR